MTVPATAPVLSRRERLRRWWGKDGRSIAGSSLLGASIVVLIYLAVRASSTEPPTASENVLLVVIASGLQIASAASFNGNGRADPALARSAVRRLIVATDRARSARHDAEQAEFGTAAAAKKAMGSLSVQLSFIEEDIAQAAKDWGEFHPDATMKLEETNQ